MVLAEFKVYHLVLEFKNSAHHAVENVPKNAPFLRVNNLVVSLFQTPEDLDVLDVHGSQQLERGNTVLPDQSTLHQGTSKLKCYAFIQST